MSLKILNVKSKEFTIAQDILDKSLILSEQLGD